MGKSNRNASLYASLGFLFFTVLILAKGAHSWVEDWQMRSICIKETTGFVINIDIYHNDETGSYTKILICEYLVNGDSYTMRGVEMYEKYEVGDEIEILYSPENPNVSMLKENTSDPWIITLIFGGFFGIIGLGFLRLYLKKEEKKINF
jgi:hypothetical protein